MGFYRTLSLWTFVLCQYKFKTQSYIARIQRTLTFTEQRIQLILLVFALHAHRYEVKLQRTSMNMLKLPR